MNWQARKNVTLPGHWNQSIAQKARPPSRAKTAQTARKSGT